MPDFESRSIRFKHKSNLAVNPDCAELQYTFTIWAKNITTLIHKTQKYTV